MRIDREVNRGIEEEGEEILTSVDIKDFLEKWEDVRRVIQIHHPNKVNAGHSVNLLEENAIRHFRNVLKMKQKQLPIEYFLMKMEKCPSSNSQVGATAKKRLKKQKT